ncbi:MAG: hypothetical protein ACLQO6_12680 [Desulfomonilaceae bacterium]
MEIMRVTKMKYLRLQYGAELKDVAAHLGVTDGYVCKLEGGWFTRISDQMKARIIEFYGEPFEDLQKEMDFPVIKRLPKLEAKSVAA